MLLADSFHLDDGGETFLQNIDSYKSHTASHPEDGVFKTEEIIKSPLCM
jgi:hypothetical protein